MTKCANEVSTSAFISFILEEHVSRLLSADYSTNIPLDRSSDVPNFESVLMP